MALPWIDRPERNIAGTCELLVVDVAEVVSVGEVIEDNMTTAVALVADAAWTKLRLALPGSRLKEGWRQVDGRPVYDVAITGFAAKDELAKLTKLRTGGRQRYLVLYKGLDGDMLLLGTKDRGAMFSVSTRDRGDEAQPVNGYDIAFTRSAAEPVPFYLATPPSSIPAGCPTLPTLLAPETGAAIWAMLDSGQQADLLVAAGVQLVDGIDNTGPPYTGLLIDANP